VNAQLADIDEEELEVDTLNVNSQPSNSKGNAKAPGTYPYPLATNRSKKTPPRPCRNCGSLYHYDRDCASWRKLGSSNEKPRPNSKANDAYHKSYVAMVEGNKSNYEALCATFYSIIDNDTPNEMVATETYTVRCETFDKANLSNKDLSKEPSSFGLNNEYHWASLQASDLIC
jgi:hypothetical protein